MSWAVLLAALALSLAPGLYMVSLSFMDNPQLFAGQVVAWPLHPGNYPRAWVASNIGRLYWNSIYVSTVSMVATVAISALAGYGLGRIRFAGRGVVYGIVLVGLTIPLQIALIPLFATLSTESHAWHGIDSDVKADVSLESPELNVGSDPFRVTFRHHYDFEADATAASISTVPERRLTPCFIVLRMR